jgi:hypothetical protein
MAILLGIVIAVESSTHKGTGGLLAGVLLVLVGCVGYRGLIRSL